MIKEEAIKELKEHIAICMYTLECTDELLEAEEIAIESLEKLSRIEDAIYSCDTCEYYHGIKEYPEIKCFQDIKEIVSES